MFSKYKLQKAKQYKRCQAGAGIQNKEWEGTEEDVEMWLSRKCRWSLRSVEKTGSSYSFFFIPKCLAYDNAYWINWYKVPPLRKFISNFEESNLKVWKFHMLLLLMRDDSFCLLLIPMHYWLCNAVSTWTDLCNLSHAPFCSYSGS